MKNPNEKFYPDGMFFFPSHPKAPEWAKGKAIIYEGFVEWLKNAFNDPELVTMYNGKKQIQFELNLKQNEPNKGYAKISTYQKEPQAESTFSSSSNDDDDLFG